MSTPGVVIPRLLYILKNKYLYPNVYYRTWDIKIVIEYWQIRNLPGNVYNKSCDIKNTRDIAKLGIYIQLST